MAKQKSALTLSAFDQQLKKVLKYYDDPARIGAESPLASPYFLSHALKDVAAPTLAHVRGETLRREIRKAAAILWGGPLPKTSAEFRAALVDVRPMSGTARYAYAVLELRCFQQWIKLRRTAEIWESEEYLPGSQAEHYRDFDLAISLLSQALLQRLHPTLRPERPVAPTRMIGYDVYAEQALAALAAGKIVSIQGPGGIGKTTLGATIFQRVTNQPVFWYTVRPMLNDRVTSLLFALGHFLHQQGSSNLWQFLLATGGAVGDTNLALALLREDFAALQPQVPVLCFDEVDCLVAGDPDQRPPGHIQLLQLLESLRGAAPLLLIGQQATLEADLYLTPAGLTSHQIQRLFHGGGCRLSEDEARQLYHYTSGNPRLIMLCLLLQQSGETVAEYLPVLERTPGMAAIMVRLWQRLDSAERQLLQRISVFRTPAPVDGWATDQACLTRLVERRLAYLDGQGGVALLPALGQHIYHELSPDLRERLHLEAAEMRLIYGQYSSAAYHYWKGNRTGKAIQAWYPHATQEVQRGQSDAAFAVFSNISRHGLSQAESQALGLIQAELYKLQGDLAQARASLEKQDWSKDSEVSIAAKTLQAEFLEALGYPDAALRTYEDALTVSARLLAKVADIHQWRSRLHNRQKELSAAWREARLAECHVHTLRGLLEYEGGRYQDAVHSLQNAARLAQSQDDVRSLAVAERFLAHTYSRQKHWEKAEEHIQNTVAAYQRLNDKLGLMRTYGSLATIFMDMQQFQQAVHYAKLAFEGAKAHPYTAAVAAANLAESYLELGDLAQAQHYAYEVLNLEERQPYPYALFTLGRIKQQFGASQDAQLHFAESMRIGQANADPFIAAYAQRELGSLIQAMGQTETAQHHLTAALRFFEGAGLTVEADKTRAILAGISMS
jgi:tetratricopeptide (TPR) repeat protein